MSHLNCNFFSVPNKLGPNSRQTSSSSNNRESSLDDSGVVDDHETEGYATSEDATSHTPAQKRVSSMKIDLLKFRIHYDIIVKVHTKLYLPFHL